MQCFGMHCESRVLLLLMMVPFSDETEPLLQRVAVLSGADGGGVSLGGYWVKVMRLFEQVPSAEWVVGVASVAVEGVPSNHPTAVSASICKSKCLPCLPACLFERKEKRVHVFCSSCLLPPRLLPVTASCINRVFSGCSGHHHWPVTSIKSRAPQTCHCHWISNYC